MRLSATTDDLETMCQQPWFLRRLSRMSTTLTRPGWLFLSNHGYVLVCIARDPSTRISELADPSASGSVPPRRSSPTSSPADTSPAPGGRGDGPRTRPRTIRTLLHPRGHAPIDWALCETRHDLASLAGSHTDPLIVLRVVQSMENGGRIT